MLRFIQAVVLLCVTGQLSGCFQVELGGPVASATLSVTELRTGAVVQEGLVALDEDGFIAQRSQEKWDKLDDVGRLINLGNVFVDTSGVVSDRFYLLTAIGGDDLDANSDRAIDDSVAPVAGSWHAIIRGTELTQGGFMVSTITEAIYQSVKDQVAQLDDGALAGLLDDLAGSILADVDDNGVLNYIDALEWTVLFHIDQYQLDYTAVENLAAGIRAGADDAELASLAGLVMEEGPDAAQFFADNISSPIVQGRCIACHVTGGVAPISGARIVFVSSSDGDHLTKNHEAFIGFGEVLGSTDLSDYVTDKAQGLRGHGGGQQLGAGSQDLINLETYLNLLE